jgi:hypothetical protein
MQLSLLIRLRSPTSVKAFASMIISGLLVYNTQSAPDANVALHDFGPAALHLQGSTTHTLYTQLRR